LASIGYSLASIFKPPNAVFWRNQQSHSEAADYGIFEPPTQVGGYANQQGRQVNPL
jgi:hypothetical protein